MRARSTRRWSIAVCLCWLLAVCSGCDSAAPTIGPRQDYRAAQRVLEQFIRDELDLDAPVTRYLPDFHPGNSSCIQITLRQLMPHRSDLVREPPVGHYFDPTAPSLEQTVSSLNGTALVYTPETVTKYSNAAMAAVGYVLE